jgi:hypothetical protein
MVGSGEKRVLSGSFKCFVPVEVAFDPIVTTLVLSAASVAVDSIDTLVESHISTGRLSDVDLCAGVQRTFDASKSVYEIDIAWSTKPAKPSDARQSAIKALQDRLIQDLQVAPTFVVQPKRRVHLMSKISKAQPTVYRRVTFAKSDASENLIRECFDDGPVNLFPRLASEISKAALVACGYCKESSACIDTLYSPRFLSSSLSSAAVMLFERSSTVFPLGSARSFAEKLLFRNNVFFPPKVTIQKSIVRLLTSNIDESNSGIIMKVFRKCRHISVLTLLIGTCLRLIRTPTKVDLGKLLLLDIVKIAVKAEKDTIAAFSKLCEVSFLDIRGFLQKFSSWDTPTRLELTQEWDSTTAVGVDLVFLPW